MRGPAGARCLDAVLDGWFWVYQVRRDVGGSKN